eukprot:TRINITY_DN117_c0_g1_i2.p1 TRINITY_DN117_c0_g1~~TRINITY_DN117_c0_g1_i2.p1  ORF type:complete len:134 (-),score=16.23 TRINITY_DN117_c0_g1_i2:587-988(-)
MLKNFSRANLVLVTLLISGSVLIFLPALFDFGSPATTRIMKGNPRRLPTSPKSVASRFVTSEPGSEVQTCTVGLSFSTSFNPEQGAILSVERVEDAGASSKLGEFRRVDTVLSESAQNAVITKAMFHMLDDQG